MVLNVLIKNENPNICGTGGLRVKRVCRSQSVLLSGYVAVSGNEVSFFKYQNV